MTVTGGTGNSIANSISLDDDAQWQTVTDGDAHVEVDGSDLTFRVFKCSTGTASLALGTGKFRISFNYQIESEEWYEYPVFDIIEDGVLVYRGIVGDKEDDETVNFESVWDIEPYETTSGQVTKDWETDGIFEIRLGLRPSDYCSNSDHANTWLRITDLSITPLEDTRTATPADTSGETTPTPSVDRQTYNLESAHYTKVHIGNRTYYVMGSVPGEDGNVWAVTTPDFELAWPEEALDALLTYVLSSPTYGFDWKQEQEAAELRLQNAEWTERLNHWAQMGVNVIQLLNPIARRAPSDSFRTAVDLFVNTLEWAHTELNDPYKKAYSEMAAVAMSTNRFEEDVNDIQSVGQFNNDILAIVDASIDLYQSAQDGQLLSAGVVEMMTDLGDFGLTRRQEEVINGSAKLLAGGEIDIPVAQFEDSLEIRARIGGLLYGYEWLRIPMMTEIQRYIDYADQNRLTPGAGFKLHTLWAAYHYIGATAFAAVGELYQNLSDMLSGRIWNIVDDSDAEAEFFRNGSENRLDAANLQYKILGAAFVDGYERYDLSLNKEVYGELP